MNDIKIILDKNSGYKWYDFENIRFKGYFFCDEKFYDKQKAIDKILKIDDFESFIIFLKQINGFFSIIVEKNNAVWAAVDIARSMPIFYSKELDCISDDAERIRLNKLINKDEFDEKRLLELYATSFVAGENTVYERIKQIEYGTAVLIKQGEIKKERYYIHYRDELKFERKEALFNLNILTKMAIKRAIEAANGRQIVLSLSGGYDSRYVACSLRESGVKDVICYSYGKKNSFEMEQSKKIADALGYKWIGIEYNDEDICSIIEKDLAYIDYFTTHDFTAYIQNYIAVKIIKEKQMVPNDSVFFTGCVNDCTTGVYIPSSDICENYEMSAQGLAEYIFDLNFVKISISKNAKEFYIESLKEKINSYNIKIYNYSTFAKMFNCIIFGNEHTRWYCHMNRAHEFMGYEWIMPCMDKDLLDFWYSQPVDYLIRQNLYEEYVTKILAYKYGVGQKKHVEYNAKTITREKIKRKLGGLAVSILYPLGIPIKRKADINNFSGLEVKLYKAIKQKNAIRKDRAGISLLLNIFCMERRYGTNWWGIIRKNINTY